MDEISENTHQWIYDGNIAKATRCTVGGYLWRSFRCRAVGFHAVIWGGPTGV